MTDLPPPEGQPPVPPPPPPPRPDAPAVAITTSGSPAPQEESRSRPGVLLLLLGLGAVGLAVLVGLGLSGSDDESVAGPGTTESLDTVVGTAVESAVTTPDDGSSSGDAAPVSDPVTTDDATAATDTSTTNDTSTTTDAGDDDPTTTVDDAPEVVAPVEVDDLDSADRDEDETEPVVGPDEEPNTSINPRVTLPDGNADSPVPESKATIRNGQIFFEGAVPTREAADEIVGLATEILGPDNVFDDYVIDARAADPSGGNITVEDTIEFATDSFEILPESESLLNQGLALFDLRPEMTVIIVGHTDDRGTPESNMQLSLARAQSVKDWYVERRVDPARLTVFGAGGTEPIASNDTVDGRRQNRRIQFLLENVLS